MGDVIKLDAGGVTVLVRQEPTAPPEVLYWGRSLPELGEADARALDAPGLGGTWLVPLSSVGSWNEEPGLSGTFDGRGFSPRFGPFEVEASASELSFSSTEERGRLRLEGRLAIEPSGLLALCARVTNLADEPYGLGSLTLCLPVPERESEILEETGDWAREHFVQRHEFTYGTHQSVVRNCQPQDASSVYGTCVPGAG